MSWAPARRFWTRVEVRPVAGGTAIELDARPLRTPGRAPVVVPGPALAEAIAAEWAAVEGEIRPEALPLTRMVNTAIDRLPARRPAVIAELVAYGGSDLLCYRAEAPETLQMRQAAAWDPWLGWARHELGAPLIAAVGVMPVAQPPASLAALERAVAGHDAFALAGLSELVTLSGSLVLALAVARGAIEAPAAWELSRLDETWQAEQWGQDSEAEAANARKQADFLRAAGFIALVASS